MSKQFPGAPLQGGFFFPMTFMKMSDDFNQGNNKSKQIGKMLKDLAIIMTGGRKEYFDLYNSIYSYYPEVNNFWNKEVFQALGGSIGSGKMVAAELDNSIIKKEIEDIDHVKLNTLFAIIQFTRDEEQIKITNKENDIDYPEQCEILSIILWTIYISIFRADYLQKTSSILNNQRVLTLKNNKHIKEILKGTNLN